MTENDLHIAPINHLLTPDISLDTTERTEIVLTGIAHLLDILQVLKSKDIQQVFRTQDLDQLIQLLTGLMSKIRYGQMVGETHDKDAYRLSFTDEIRNGVGGKLADVSVHAICNTLESGSPDLREMSMYYTGYEGQKPQDDHSTSLHFNITCWISRLIRSYLGLTAINFRSSLTEVTSYDDQPIGRVVAKGKTAVDTLEEESFQILSFDPENPVGLESYVTTKYMKVSKDYLELIKKGQDFLLAKLNSDGSTTIHFAKFLGTTSRTDGKSLSIYQVSRQAGSDLGWDLGNQ